MSSVVVPSATSSSISSHTRLPAARVEAGRRLVEEQHRRPGDQAHGDVEAAAHAAGVALDHPVAGVDEVEALEQLAPTLAGRGDRHVEQAPDVLEVLGAGEPLVDGGVLAGEPDARLGPHRLGDHVDAVDEGPPGVGLDQRREDAHGGGLAGAVGPEHAEHLGPFDAEVDAVERLGLAEPLHQALGQHGRFAHVVDPSEGVHEARRRIARCSIAGAVGAEVLAALVGGELTGEQTAGEPDELVGVAFQAPDHRAVGVYEVAAVRSEVDVRPSWRLLHPELEQQLAGRQVQQLDPVAEAGGGQRAVGADLEIGDRPSSTIWSSTIASSAGVPSTTAARSSAHTRPPAVPPTSHVPVGSNARPMGRRARGGCR